MDLVHEFIDEVMNTGPANLECHAAPEDNYKTQVDEIFLKVENLAERVNVIEKYYSSTKTKEISTLIKDKEKIIPSMKKIHQDASRREAAAAKRMQELMRQFGPIFRQITQHSCAWPFMKPVDVEGLGLHDYYKIIDRPMDFSTIKNQMEAMDGTGYKHVREIYADVRLVFKNAMKYNDRKSDVYAMAKTLQEKFEEKWLHLLPKVIDEENRRKLEEDEAQRCVQLVQEVANAKLAKDLNNELYQVDMYIDELREMVVKQCRRFSTTEKRKLGVALSQLSPEDLSKALEIVAQDNPNFQATAEEVELDINAQSESTLWRLKFFVNDMLKDESKNSPDGDRKNNNIANSRDGSSNQDNNIISKRKREICNALAKTAKRNKKKTAS